MRGFDDQGAEKARAFVRIGTLVPDHLERACVQLDRGCAQDEA
jgi:hypothetical protein